MIIILVVAVLILGGFVVFSRVRNRAIDDKADAATTDLRSAWRDVDLARLREAYDEANTQASASGDYSASIKLIPTSDDATFISADLSRPSEVAARYSVETWAGNECLDVVTRSPVPNRVTFTTHKGC